MNSKNQKGIAHIFVVFGLIILTGVAGLWLWKNKISYKKFETEEECETQTNKECHYYLCDIPIGEIYEKICLNGPGSGWYTSETFDEIKSSSESNITTSNNSMENWKTYNSEAFGIKFRYPPNWQIVENKMEIQINNPDKLLGFLITTSSSDDKGRLVANLRNTTSQFPSQSLILESDIRIGNYPAIEVMDKRDSHVQSDLYFILEDRNKVIHATFLYRNDERRKTIKKILSTFEFVDVVESEELLDVTLEIKAPFSTSKLIVNSDNIDYSENNRTVNPPRERSEKVDIAEDDFEKLESLLLQSNLEETLNTYWTPKEPTDLSTYAITYKTIPSEPEQRILADAKVTDVECYETTCSEEFLKIKDEIIKLWGKDVLEIGI